MAESNQSDIGKKVFFLYPHSVIEEKLVQVILRSEYEVYLVYDHKKTVKLLSKYPNSILFVNIDTELSEEDWESYIRSLMEREDTKSSQIGILTYNEDKDLARKYLMDIGVPCGFVRLKLGFEESTKIILKTLIATEARGQRKHVRAQCSGQANVSFNVQYGTEIHKGSIIDISIVGMACTFDSPVKFEQGAAFKDIQLKLKGKITKVSGTVAGSRQQTKPIYVILFDQNFSGDVRGKIHYFIHQSLQDEIQQIMTAL